MTKYENGSRFADIAKNRWTRLALGLFITFALFLWVTGKGFLIWESRDVEDRSGIHLSGDDPFQQGLLTCTYWVGIEIVDRTFVFGSRGSFEEALCPRWRQIR